MTGENGVKQLMHFTPQPRIHVDHKIKRKKQHAINRWRRDGPFFILGRWV